MTEHTETDDRVETDDHAGSDTHEDDGHGGTGRPNDGTADRATTEGSRTSRRAVLRAAATGVAGASLAAASRTPVGTAAGASESTGVSTPPLHRDGNLIRDPDGNRVILRGLNTADPKRLDVTAPARGKNAVQTIDYATSAAAGWHPRVIRLPVQPVDIGEHEPGEGPEPVAFDETQLESYLTNHLDPVVDRCEERGVYCIVDFHRHRNVRWTNDALDEELRLFWDVVAPRYADRDHVIYEVFNEPIGPHLGRDPAERTYQARVWRRWVDTAQPWVDTIRRHADNLVLVGSPTWSQSPEGARVEEFAGEDIVYTYHVYPGHDVSESGNWAGNNDQGQGTSRIYEEVPLFVTEFGWQRGISAFPVIGTTEGFGRPFVEWLDSAPIHWTAWCFDPVWLSAMTVEDFDTPGFTDAVGNPYEEDVPALCEDRPCAWEAREGMGTYIKQVLAERRHDDLPGGGNAGDGDGDDDGGDDGSDDEDAPDAPTWPADATDPDGDGYYEDLNGNGRVDYDDVVTYFENMENERMRADAAYYDYNDNGRIDYTDLIDLFRSV